MFKCAMRVSQKCFQNNLNINYIHKNTMFKYSVIPTTKVSEVSKFLLGSFFVDEPLGKALGLSVSQVQRWFPTYIAYTVTHSVSIMVEESSTNELVGALICIIFNPSSPPKVTMSGLINHQEPTMAQIDRILTTNWDIKSTPKEKTLIHLFLSVHKNYGGKGIAKQMIDQAEAKAREKGVRLAMVDATSEFSSKAYERRGYKIIREAEYVNIEDGRNIKPLAKKKAELGVHQYLRLLSKRI